MNREIKFRGLSTHAGAWVEGFYFFNGNEHGIITNGRYPGFWVQVEVETVGQFTCRKDKNGAEIYEGDICKAPHDFGPGGWSERTFTVNWNNEVGYQWSYWNLEKLEVVGNIYQNPELLPK